MLLALLLVLTCAVATSAAGYAEYSGVKMPQYGGAEYDIGDSASHPSDDYHGHSPDAPASPDYKYEEEPRSKTEKPLKEHDTERWQKPGRKQRELVRSPESDTAINKYFEEDDEIPKFRTNRHYSKHRSRLKNEIEERIEETPVPRRSNKYIRDRKEVSDIDRKDYFVDKEYIPDNKNKDYEDDTITKRTNRRRPRDKNIKRQRDAVSDYDEAAPPNRQLKGDSDQESHVQFDERSRLRSQLRKSPGLQTLSPTAVDEEDDPFKPNPGPFKLKGYNEYEDYYDMKRVNKIKNKLPSLLRRTTVGTVSRTSTALLNMLIPNRRMMIPGVDQDRPTTEKAVTQTVETTTTTTTTITEVTPARRMQELSLAEKSRLSILKKAQRKEGANFRSTKKPPVLMQVTSQMPTVVMVEPPSSTVAWMRAKDEEDTPGRLQIVKRLMRQKLVKEAKTIRDLTDNWDSVVCDYIDMSLLENSAMPIEPMKIILLGILQVYLFV